MSELVKLWIDINHYVVNLMIRKRVTDAQKIEQIVESSVNLKKMVVGGSFLFTQSSNLNNAIAIANKITFQITKLLYPDSINRSKYELFEHFMCLEDDEVNEHTKDIVSCINLTPLEISILQDKIEFVNVNELDKTRERVIVRINNRYKKLFGIKTQIKEQPDVSTLIEYVKYKGFHDNFVNSIIFASLTAFAVFFRLIKPVSSTLNVVLGYRQMAKKVSTLPQKISKTELTTKISVWMTRILMFNKPASAFENIEDGIDEIMVHSFDDKAKASYIIKTLKMINDRINTLEGITDIQRTAIKKQCQWIAEKAETL